MHRFLRLTLCFLCPLMLMPVLIYLVDPFGIYREDFTYQVIEPNQHFVKMQYLMKDRQPYDSFIWGSSKVSNVDSRKLEGGHYYNMTYSMGLPYEWYHDLKMLLEAGYPVKNAVITLDELTYARTHFQNNSFLRTPYPEGQWDRLKFHLSYLFRIPNFNTLRYAFYPLNKDQPYRVGYDIFNSGIAFKTERETYVTQHMAEHLQDPRFNQAVRTYLVNMEESLTYIEKMKALCAEKGISFRVVFTPVHHKKWPVLLENRFLEYKERLSEITPYWDFSGPSPITEDNQYWFEQHHFRMPVGDMIVAALNSGRAAPEIARFVTQDTPFAPKLSSLSPK